MYNKNLTFRQVSYLSDVPKSTIEDICKGKNFRMDTLEKIAKGLDIPFEDLYKLDDD